MMANEDSRSCVNCVVACFKSQNHCVNPKPNTGVPIVIMPFTGGSNNLSLLFTNAITINARPISLHYINSINRKKNYRKQNPLNSNSDINFENIILPNSTLSIARQIKQKSISIKFITPQILWVWSWHSMSHSPLPPEKPLLS